MKRRTNSKFVNVPLEIHVYLIYIILFIQKRYGLDGQLKYI